jgi:hypothetical protein
MSVDLTSIADTTIAGLLSIIVTIFLAWLSSHMKDQAAAATIGAAVQNAVGAVQRATAAGLDSHPLLVKLPFKTSPATAAGVQYVLDHAGKELARFSGITPAVIADKVEAQIGLAKLATTTTTAPPALPPALPPVPRTT